jgi:hypothetical protein
LRSGPAGGTFEERRERAAKNDIQGTAISGETSMAAATKPVHIEDSYVVIET